MAERVVTDVIVAIIGTSRRIPAALRAITSTMEALDRETIIVTGDGPGTDLHVKRECKRLGFRFIECHARWGTQGRRAWPERNQMIARLAQRVIAWPAAPEFPATEREMSAGSWNCVDQFRERGKPVDVREDAWRTAA